MVLHANGQALVLWRQAGTSGDGPAFEHPVKLQAQVVVQSARRMLLHDEHTSAFARQLAARLCRAREVALAGILAQSGACHRPPAHPTFLTRALPLRAALAGLPSAGLLTAFLPSGLCALGLAALFISPSTLRRRASIRLMTLVWRCVGCGLTGMPFALERISSISAFS